MAGIKGTRYGQARRAAYALWRGPDFAQQQSQTEALGGNRVLSLAIRKGSSLAPLLESRSVYGSLVSDRSSDAILRAVSWNSQTARHPSPTEAISEIVPARFVRIPAMQVQQWLRKFDGLHTTLSSVAQTDDQLPICSLRIEADAVYSVFEQVWQVVPGEQSELTHIWLDVWNAMGQTLQTEPAIQDVEESFPCVEGKPAAYDFQTYEPWLTLP
jgi:hypothetical protein